MSSNKNQENKTDKKLTVIVILAALALMAIMAAGYWFFFARSELPSRIRQHFRKLDQVEFCTIQPRSIAELGNQGGYGKGEIDGYAIVDMVKTGQHDDLIRQLARADRENNTKVANCFNPRHAIRDPSNADNFLLVCFECYQMRYQFNGEKGLVLIRKWPLSTFESFIDQNNLKRAGE